MTLECVRINFGRSERTLGISFVALSRVRRIEDVLIDFEYFDSKRLTDITIPQYVVQFDELTLLLAAKTTEEFNKINL